MPGTIQLERLSVAEVTSGYVHAWPLKVIATSSATGIPSEIFVYHAEGGNDEFVGDIFVAVASVMQLTELPKDAPILIPDENGKVVPFYRKSTMEFFCRTPEEADELWANIMSDVTDLKTNFEALQDLQVSETVTI